MQTKIDVDPELELDPGLCSTCIHADHCALRSNPYRAVYECEEFSIGPAAKEPSRLRIVDPPGDRVEPVDGLRGLCVNCEHRDSCTLPRPAGGVWHCEEYR